MSCLEKKDRIIIKCFEVAVQIGDDRYGVGTGRTKKAAEQEAAYQSYTGTSEKEHRVGEVCI